MSMTQLELANEIGMTAASINRIENGRTIPSLPTLKRLSDLLQKPIHYLGCFEDLSEDTFGQKLKKARMFRGLTKVEAGQYLGVDAKTIFNLEQDQRKPINQYRGKIVAFLSILCVPN